MQDNLYDRISSPERHNKTFPKIINDNYYPKKVLLSYSCQLNMPGMITMGNVILISMNIIPTSTLCGKATKRSAPTG